MGNTVRNYVSPLRVERLIDQAEPVCVSIRKMPAGVAQHIRRRAVASRRSFEAEMRHILAQAMETDCAAIRAIEAFARSLSIGKVCPCCGKPH